MKTDARKLSPEAQKEKRRVALKMRESGYGYEEISRILEVHKNTIGNWVSKKNKKGIGAVIEGDKRGIKTGQSRTLTVKQEKNITRLILIHTPDKFGFSDALWTRKSVKELIDQKCHINMPIRTVGEYLKRWGFTPQKPMKKAYEQNRNKVEQWLKED
jgi:transposase